MNSKSAMNVGCHADRSSAKNQPIEFIVDLSAS